MVAVSGLMVTIGARSYADLMPSFPSTWNPGDAVAGQSTLYVSSGSGVPITVDWIVVYWGNVGPNGAPVWGYYYQLENPENQPAGKTITVFTVSTLHGPPFFAAGFISGQSLDENFNDGYGNVMGHDLSPLEFEPEPGDIQDPVTPPDLSRYKVTYSFNPPESANIAIGNQSSVLTAYATFAPMYGIGTAQNSDVQWRGLVPVPSPEPSVGLLLLMGLMGGSVVARWRRRR